MDKRLYERPEYWEKRYEADRGEYFEWFLSFKDLEPLLEIHLKKKYIKNHFRVLDVGCGNSSLLFDLAQSDFLTKFCGEKDKSINLVGIDISTVVIEDMNQRLSKVNSNLDMELKFEFCDVSNELNFGDDYFSVVVDKSTMDTLLHDKKNGESVVKQMLAEISRILDKDGIYVLVSQMNYESEDDCEFLMNTIIPSLTRDDARWEIHCHSVEGCPFTVYCFVKQKLHHMSRRSGVNYNFDVVLKEHIH